jgi:hypothetical protein
MCSLLLNVLFKEHPLLTLCMNAFYCALTLYYSFISMSMNVFAPICSRMVGQDGYLFRAPGRCISDNSGFKLQATSCKPFSFLPSIFSLTLLVKSVPLLTLNRVSTISLLIPFLFRGEYRSRTDDLLLAKQAL